MHTANNVADWFLMWADSDDAEVSNLKLQKLLYYAQGHYLGLTGSSLFEDEIQAWAHGPVVPNVYHRLKKYGRNPVDVADAVFDGFDWDDFRDIEDHLIRVWNTYGQYDAWALRERTHRERPWLEAIRPDARQIEIVPSALKEFFATQP
jgi:uncharacterized phage-associated protein